MAEYIPGPSSSGSVVLDLGPGQGALVLHTPPELDGLEIEISRHDGAPGPRTHSQVRQRRTAGNVQYAAVYPGLAAGDYQLWRDATTALLTFTITGGSVTTIHWPDQPAAATPPTHHHPHPHGHDHPHEHGHA